MNQKFRRDESSALEYIQSPGGSAGKSGILCHGFGASGMDLCGLENIIDPEGERTWLFPQAPYPMPGFPGWAWFPENRSLLQQALSGNYFHDLENMSDRGLDQNARRIVSLCTSVQGNIPVPNTVLGGFSQGSMIALRAALLAKAEQSLKIDAVLIFSGTLVDIRYLTSVGNSLSGLKIFCSHGRYDQLLDYHAALRQRDFLIDSGAEVDWHEFPGGHQIPESALTACYHFLKRL